MMPAGVMASNGCSRNEMPLAFSCDSMYWRQAASAAEPAGRGPKATCFWRCVHALEASNFRAATGVPGFCASAPHAIRSSASAVSGQRWHRRTLLTALVEGHVIPPLGSGIDLPRSRDLLIRVENHLFPLRNPARRARNREQHREHRDREAHGLVDQPRVEIDVRIQLPVDEVIILERDAFEFERDVEQ